MLPDRLQRSLRATFLGLAVNVALAAAKFLAGVFGNSQALIADAVESLADSFAVKTDAWHHRSDAITSLAAFIGITIALVGGKGYENADNWAALVAAVVIAINGWVLLRPAFNELMDHSPDRELIEQIKSI